ncbi:cytochrome P450 [Mycena galericulata]|nr:cytochrome P450 [Mycena galericulata]
MGTAGIIISLLLVLCSIRAQRRVPNEPPLLPSTIPIFHHIYKYMFDLENLYKEARKFSPGLHPVSLDFLGQRVYLVLSQNDTDAICKEKKRLPYGPLLDWALPRILGISKPSLRALKLERDGPGTSIFAHSMSIVRDALKPGPSLDDFTTSFLGKLQEGLVSVDHRLDKGEIHTDLVDWTYNLVGSSSTYAMMGSRFLQYDPTLLQRNRRFEDDFFLFALGLPRFLTRGAWSNRSHIHDAFRRRHSNRHTLPPAAWWVDESEQVTSYVEEKDAATPTFGLWHALQSNPNNIIFWMLSQIICPGSLLMLLRAEISPAFEHSNSGLLNIEVILDETRCPLLHSLYYETLRFTSSTTVVRMVAEDTVISGYTLQRGAVVLCPARLHHFDPNLWGADADQFDPTRFMRSSHLHIHTKHLRPFGNAPTICPGRYFAMREILSVVCTIIRQYDIVADEGEDIPQLHLNSPSFGTVKPIGSMKVVIRKRL